jgi:hypothetical protein
MAGGGKASTEQEEVEDLVVADAPEPHLPRNAADLVTAQVGPARVLLLNAGMQSCDPGARGAAAMWARHDYAAVLHTTMR